MKLLGLLFVFGLIAASTSFQDEWERERDNTVFHFMKGMKMAGPLRVALGMPEAREIDYAEEDIKTELGKKIKEALDHVLEKIKKALEQKEELKQKWLDKVEELKQKLKDLHLKISDKAKDVMEKLKDRLKDYFKDLMDRLTKNEKRAISQAMELAENELSMKEVLQKVKEMITKHLNIEKIREYLEKVKGKLGEMSKIFMEKLKDSKGLEALKKLIKMILGEGDVDRDSRSLQEYWDRLKKFLKEKHLEFKEKFSQFAEWLKEAIKNGLIVADEKTTALKNIAKQIIDHSKQVSKEVAVEAMDALRPYKDDLGDLWKQLKDRVKEIVHRKD